MGRLTLSSGLHSLTDLAFTVLGIGVAVLAWRWLRPSYALYMTALLLVPLSTGTLLSMPRFVLVMFPMYLVLAILGRRAAVHETLLVVGMGLAACSWSCTHSGTGCPDGAALGAWSGARRGRYGRRAPERQSHYTARDAPRARSTQRPA